jgi:hypothetical protein
MGDTLDKAVLENPKSKIQNDLSGFPFFFEQAREVAYGLRPGTAMHFGADLSVPQ